MSHNSTYLTDLPATGFILWTRSGRRGKWRPIRAAEKAEALTNEMTKLPSGDYMTTPAGIDPNAKRARQ